MFVCCSVLSPQDPAIHNYLISLYAKEQDDAKLLDFIDESARSGNGPVFDVKYALRLCHQEQKTKACVTIYSIMGLFEVIFFFSNGSVLCGSVRVSLCVSLCVLLYSKIKNENKKLGSSSVGAHGERGPGQTRG